ncbi:MAG: hypothetical protein NG712_04405 [Omnitrophica bacterium]|nr:hypothetical protein [Candidatus Omnitrophota bacterium]
MGRYAAKTSVSVAKSKAEIERTLVRYGASEFAYASGQDRAMIGFLIDNHKIEIAIMMPVPQEFAQTETGRDRSMATMRVEWERACRQRWRALALVIKAKLEAVECGITSMQDEFLAYTVLPTGQTIGQVMAAKMTEILTGGKMPSLLLPGKVEK